MSKLTRENAILPTQNFIDMQPYVGCAVVFGNSPSGMFAEPWNPADHDEPLGVLLSADATSGSVAVLHGGLAGTVKVKLMESAGRGKRIYPINNGSVVGFADVSEALHPGNQYACGLTLEDGVAGEMVEAVLFNPEPFTIV